MSFILFIYLLFFISYIFFSIRSSIFFISEYNLSLLRICEVFHNSQRHVSKTTGHTTLPAIEIHQGLFWFVKMFQEHSSGVDQREPLEEYQGHGLLGLKIVFGTVGNCTAFGACSLYTFKMTRA